MHGANAAVVMESSRAQVEALRGERAELAGEAARLADALADAEARLKVLARRNGELRCGTGGSVVHSKCRYRCLPVLS